MILFGSNPCSSQTSVIRSSFHPEPNNFSENVRAKLAQLRKLVDANLAHSANQQQHFYRSNQTLCSTSLWTAGPAKQPQCWKSGSTLDRTLDCPLIARTIIGTTVKRSFRKIGAHKQSTTTADWRLRRSGSDKWIVSPNVQP